MALTSSYTLSEVTRSPVAWFFGCTTPVDAACAAISSFGIRTTIFTVVAVTPGAVAPPLSLPSGHGFTQKGPVPS